MATEWKWRTAIEQNVFEENRHAIAGGSSDPKRRDYSGYTVRDNPILPGGGLHCGTKLGVTVCRRTHQIDMHGDTSTFFGAIGVAEQREQR
jgi:hypothetical protein